MKTNDLVLGLGSNGAFTTSESHATPRNRPGEIAEVLAPEGYRWLIYQNAEEAFAIGQCAMMHPTLLDNADVDQAQATTTAVLRGDSDFTANQFGSSAGAAHPDGYVTIDENTGLGQTRHIKYNRGSTSYLTVDHNWDTALDTTSDYVTYAINYVSLADTDDISEDATIMKGVAVSAITDEQWGWFQIKGFNPLIRAVADTDAIVRGEPIVASGTAGACKGPDATLDAADAITKFGIAQHAYAAADAAGRGIAAELRWMV